MKEVTGEYFIVLFYYFLQGLIPDELLEVALRIEGCRIDRLLLLHLSNLKLIIDLKVNEIRTIVVCAD